ncbi:MAG: urease accessory protein UreD [Acetobacteraceae bacterium]|jgi:urease accessory protein|nr:urease accessory protein UreD [Acetobacteraceae bacterium]
MAPSLSRAEGRLGLSFARRGARTVLARLDQSGALRARLPRPERGAFAGAVTLNTAGGIASGDRLTTDVTWHEGASATVSAAAAERVYRARMAERPARVETTLTIGPGAVAEWLPQETILFDGARLDRTLSISLAPDAAFLAVEALVFGRTARGEVLREGALSDRVTLRRGGALVFADRLSLAGDIAAILARPATGAGAAAVASLLWVGSDAETARERLRVALADVTGAEAGASLRDGIVLARIVARDGLALRRAVVAGLAALRHDRPLPRVWQC